MYGVPGATLGWIILTLGVVGLIIWANSRRSTGRHADTTARGCMALHDAPRQKPTVDAMFSDGWLTINSVGYFGEYVRSSNGRYVLSWTDSDPGGMRGGARKSGKGVYLLLDNNRLILQGRMPRPNDGVVSNVGIFAINDWTFEEGLHGVFHVISPTGAPLVRQRTRANLENCGISEDGRFAVCQTLFSHCEAHSGKLFFFDVGTRSLLWRKEPATGRTTHYRFDTANRILWLCVGDDQEYRYTFDGKFLDEEKWRVELSRRRTREASGYDLLSAAEQKLKELEIGNKPIEEYGEAESLLRRALEQRVSPYTAGQIHRHLGEIAEKAGRLEDAISAYEDALRMNPKVGVKKRLEKLRQQKA